MKIATIINPILTKQTNIILDNTAFAKNICYVYDKSFRPTQMFFDFVEDLIGKDTIGKINDCYVSIIDSNNVANYINPINKLINILNITNSVR